MRAALAGLVLLAAAPSAAAPRVVARVRGEVIAAERERLVAAAAGGEALEVAPDVPLYAHFDLRDSQLSSGLSLVLSGYGVVELASRFSRHRGLSELVAGYLHQEAGGLQARLGRQLLFSGTSRGLHLDGLHLRYRLPADLGGALALEAWGGVPVADRHGPHWYAPGRSPGSATRAELARGLTVGTPRGQDRALGARVSHRRLGRWDAGLSVLDVREDGGTAHRVVGLDAALHPARWLSATGVLAWDLPASQVQEATLRVDLLPAHRVDLSVYGQLTRPHLFLSQRSIFSVFAFSDVAEVGADAGWWGADWCWLSLGGARRFYAFDETTGTAGDLRSERRTDTGTVVSAAVRLVADRLHRTLLSLGVERTADDELANSAGRLSARAPLSALLGVGVLDPVSAYGELYCLTTHADGLDRPCALGVAGLAYREGPWTLGLALRAGATQRRDDELAGMLQVAYEHASGPGGGP